ncbi:hypothetical protein CPB86DRAFT_869306 [Serendipita vermifera]|nr:hypothetical protein CPB86DRAFT_869306 [Serendipita vermifera]
MAIIEHLPTSFPSNSTVEKLRFYLDFEWKDQPGKFVDDNVPIGFAERQKIDEFGGLMIQSFPMIWDLSLFLSALPGIDFLSEVFDLRKANHLSCLQRLYISSEFVIDSSELPPCDTLKVHCENRDDLIRLSNRKTRHLTMDSGYSGKVERNLRYRSWPSLETLTIPACLISSAETRFPHLREIILNTKSASGSITKFCRRLAPHPNLCPALETLSIDEFPEWDIFFIMLERRLLLGAKGATAFKYITLPASSPLNLLHHVCEILQGRLPDRPSNFDLSLLSKTKALLDETITSCLRCIRSDRRCQNTSLRPMELPSEQERSKWIRSLPKYPQNEDHILWTWKKRSRAWNKGVSLAKFRVEKCDHSTYGSIRLDQFTSLDVDVK